MENEKQQSVGQTKKCPKCGEEIQVSAKKCKHCQADLRNWFVRHKIMTGILALVVIVILINVGGSDKEENKTADVEKNKVEEVKYEINDTIKAGELELTVTSAEEKKRVGSQYFQSDPSEGGTFMAVQWKYKNVSDKPMGMFSQPSINLIDSAGTKYDSDVDASVHYATELDLDRKIISDLNPGILVNDADVFEISKEVFAKGGWSVVISADNKKYTISIN